MDVMSVQSQIRDLPRKYRVPETCAMILRHWDMFFSEYGYVLCAQVDSNAMLRLYLVGIGHILESNFSWDLHGHWEAFENFDLIERGINEKLEKVAKELAGNPVQMWRFRTAPVQEKQPEPKPTRSNKIKRFLRIGK